MQAKGWVLFRVLLNRFHGGVIDDIGKFLPESDVKRLNRLTIDSRDVEPVVGDPALQLQQTHFSWLVPLFKGLPDQLKNAMIRSLPPASAAGICQSLGQGLPAIAVSPAMQEFLLATLAKQISASRRLPAQWLPTTALSAILSYDKLQLQALVDLMGLRDLANELRHIVNRANQQILLRCLKPNELKLLKYYMYQKEKFTVPRMDLRDWTGDAAELRKQIHLRGLARLGKALSGCSQDMIWHISRILSTGRANILKSNLSPEPIPNITADMLRQLAGCMKYLKTQGTPS